MTAERPSDFDLELVAAFLLDSRRMVPGKMLPAACDRVASWLNEQRGNLEKRGMTMDEMNDAMGVGKVEKA